MPLVAGDFIVPTFGRTVFVVIGTYTVPGLIAAFRAVQVGVPSTQVFVQDVDVDASFTWFVLAFAAVPAGKPVPGSRVRILASPLALFSGVPIASAPITEPSFRGIIFSYFTIPTFPGPVYAVIVTPEGLLILAQSDELSLDNSAP